MRVLDRHQPADRLVRILRVPEGRRDDIEIERAVRAVRECPDARPDDDGMAGRLVADEVALGARDRLLARSPMVPDATKRPASFPSRAAARSSSALTVGSSPKTSSPTSASAIARRIAGVGLVTVSERRSIRGMVRRGYRGRGHGVSGGPFGARHDP